MKLSFHDPNGASGGPDRDIGAALADKFTKRIYVFRAERLNIGSCTFGTSSTLASDARNLAEVLNQLQNNPARFGRLDHTLRQIFPQICGVTVRPLHGASNQVEIVIWPHDPSTERDDLVVPLSNAGTGLGQVLAILYVVLNSDPHQVIVIDEPQSFLHPGAARKLVEILRNHPQHQYIIATHSPTIITAADPQRIIMLKLEDGETTALALDAKTAAAQKTCLLEVGATLADVFGADNILWVEGATEEACFPMILRQFLRRPQAGTVIKGVVATGDFERKEKRRAELALEIYEQLSGSLIPPALAFVFDAEGRTGQEKRDLQKRAKGRMHFLPRRMYENYLLNPAAIADVINEEPGCGSQVAEDTVSAKLEALFGERRFYESAPPAEKSERMRVVHAACLLNTIFRDVSGGTLEFRKTTHAAQLTEWLISNAPGDLSEVAQLLKKAIQGTEIEVVD